MLGKLPVPGRPTNLEYSRARAYCACSRCGWGLFGHFFSHLSLLFSFSLSFWETARYGLKYCLKEPLSPKQQTNQLYLFVIGKNNHAICTCLFLYFMMVFMNGFTCSPPKMQCSWHKGSIGKLFTFCQTSKAFYHSLFALHNGQICDIISVLLHIQNANGHRW